MRTIVRLMAVLSTLVLVACGQSPENRPLATLEEVGALEKVILALGPDIDPDEAARAARIAFSHTRELAIAYQITDPPLIHNTKVNMGLRPRGLCSALREEGVAGGDSGTAVLQLRHASATSRGHVW